MVCAPAWIGTLVDASPAPKVGSFVDGLILATPAAAFFLLAQMSMAFRLQAMTKRTVVSLLAVASTTIMFAVSALILIDAFVPLCSDSGSGEEEETNGLTRLSIVAGAAGGLGALHLLVPCCRRLWCIAVVLIDICVTWAIFAVDIAIRQGHLCDDCNPAGLFSVQLLVASAGLVLLHFVSARKPRRNISTCNARDTSCDASTFTNVRVPGYMLGELA